MHLLKGQSGLAHLLQAPAQLFRAVQLEEARLRTCVPLQVALRALEAEAPGRIRLRRSTCEKRCGWLLSSRSDGSQSITLSWSTTSVRALGAVRPPRVTSMQRNACQTHQIVHCVIRCSCIYVLNRLKT